MQVLKKCKARKIQEKTIKTFNFEIILDLQKSCKDSTEFLYTIHPTSPNANIL